MGLMKMQDAWSVRLRSEVNRYQLARRHTAEDVNRQKYLFTGVKFPGLLSPVLIAPGWRPGRALGSYEGELMASGLLRASGRGMTS
jgi:hypothetical protein